VQGSQPDSVVLVGGRGTRLRPAVADRPKPLASVAGRPFLDWILESLARQGVARVVLSAGYGAGHIESYAAASRIRGLEIRVVREEVPLGTGGGLRRALDAVETRDVLVLNGDSFCAADFGALVERRARQRARGVMLLTHVDDVSRYGSVEIDRDDAILAFREKSSVRGSGLINAGVYLLERDAVAEFEPERPISLEHEVFPSWVGRGFYGLVSDGPFIDIGTPESYAFADASLDWPSLVGSAGA
jgi:NDP-sugar pyrophosphorylase family protein